MSRRVAIVHNAHKPEEPVRRLVAGFSHDEVTVHHTHTLEQGLSTCRAAVADGVDRLIAAGGDGTVLTAVTAAAGTGTAVGVLPLGTANDLAHHLGWRSPDEAEATLTGERVRTVDSFELTATTPDGPVRWQGCTTAGAGLFAEVVRQEFTDSGQRMLRWMGPAAWLWFTVRLGLCLEPVGATLTLDGVPHDRELLTFDLMKVPSMGGFQILPDAAMDSGHLHGWTGSLRPRAGRVSALVAGLRTSGGHLRRPDVLSWGTADRPTELTLSTERPLAVHVHGEIVGTTPIAVRCHPASLRLLA